MLKTAGLKNILALNISDKLAYIIRGIELLSNGRTIVCMRIAYVHLHTHLHI